MLRDERVKCAAVQKEKCPDTAREHYQGFLMLTKPMRLMSIKAILQCESAHLEKTKGTPQQAWEYCVKDDTRIEGPWTYGDKPVGNGHRCVTRVTVTRLGVILGPNLVTRHSASTLVASHHIAPLSKNALRGGASRFFLLYWVLFSSLRASLLITEQTSRMLSLL